MYRYIFTVLTYTIHCIYDITHSTCLNKMFVKVILFYPKVSCLQHCQKCDI